MYVIKANYHCLLNFILSSFICQDSSFTLPPPQFPCSHLLATGIKVSKQYWYWVWQSIKVLPNTTQYWKILGNTQYPNANIVLTLNSIATVYSVASNFCHFWASFVFCTLMYCNFMSCIFMSCYFVPCNLDHLFHVLHLRVRQFQCPHFIAISRRLCPSNRVR